MIEAPWPWAASVQLRVDDPKVAEWLEQALRPEAAREVPRAHAELKRSGDATLNLSITAKDSGAMRAALNTYLGWIHLSLATAQAARRSD